MMRFQRDIRGDDQNKIMVEISHRFSLNGQFVEVPYLKRFYVHVIINKIAKLMKAFRASLFSFFVLCKILC